MSFAQISHCYYLPCIDHFNALENVIKPINVQRFTVTDIQVGGSFNEFRYWAPWVIGLHELHGLQYCVRNVGGPGLSAGVCLAGIPDSVDSGIA